MTKLTFRPKINTVSICKLCGNSCNLNGNDRDSIIYNNLSIHHNCIFNVRNEACIDLNALRLERNPTEYYETPQTALKALGEVLSKRRVMERVPVTASIWEPTDSNRRIGDFLASLGFNVFSSDIYPRVDGVTRRDFLTSAYKCDVIIFNPPFNEFKKLRRSIKTEHWPKGCKGWLPHALDCAEVVIALLPVRIEDNKRFFKKFENKLLYNHKIPGHLKFTSPYDKGLSISCNWYVWDNWYNKSEDERWGIHESQNSAENLVVVE